MASRQRDYVSGGYFLVRPLHPDADAPPEFMPADIVGRPVITLAECLATVLPAEWAFGFWTPAPSPEERELGAAEWAIPHESIAEITAWGEEKRAEGRIHHHDVFADVAAAAEFARRFLPPRTDALLLGIGLHRDALFDLDTALAEADSQMFGGEGAPNGILEAVRLKRPLAAGESNSASRCSTCAGEKAGTPGTAMRSSERRV